MPLTPSTLNGTVKAYKMMELANLDMENGVLQGVDSLLQLAHSSWNIQVLEGISHVDQGAK